MYNPEDLAVAMSKAMSSAGYEPSDQFSEALEDVFTEALGTDQVDGDRYCLETFLSALEYAANRVANAHNDQ